MTDIVIGKHIFHSKEELFQEIEKHLLWRERTMLNQLKGNTYTLPNKFLDDSELVKISNEAYRLGFVVSKKTCESMCNILEDIITILKDRMNTDTNVSQSIWQTMIDAHTDSLNQFQDMLKQYQP